MIGPTRATLAAFARLCLAEVDHGEMPEGEKTPPEIARDDRGDWARHLRGLATIADRATWLHLRAATHEEIEELLRLRGLPELGAYVIRVIAPGNQQTPAWCRAKADDMDRGIIGTCKAFREAPPERVAAALRWIAEALGRVQIDMRIGGSNGNISE